MSMTLGKATPKGSDILVDRCDNGCWKVKNRSCREGYPVTQVEGMKCLKVIHWILMKLGYPKPSRSLVVRHMCSHRWCVNPSHVIYGTLKDNARDMVLLGESLKGDRHPEAKLTLPQVREIKKRFSGRRGENLEIAREYHVSPGLVCSIKKGRAWSWV